MNILQLCPRVPFPPADGGAIAMVRMQEGLEENGCRVRMVCYNTSRHPVLLDELDRELVKKTGLTAVDVDNRIRPIGALVALLKNRSYHLSRFSSSAFRLHLVEALQRETFDAFILESIYLQQAIPLIRKYSKAPVILRAHNVENAIWKGLAATETNPLKKWYLSRLATQLEKQEKKILSEVDGVLAITPEDAMKFMVLAPSVPVWVSPAGISAGKYTFNPDPDPLLVAHIGAMDWQPNLEGVQWFLKEVWTRVVQSVPGARLKLAGKNMPEELLAFNGPNISVTGFVRHADEFLFDAGIVAIPLLNGSGMRIKLLEGMAMGKAIVTTPVGCEGIPVSDGENVVVAATAGAFADALIGLMADGLKQNRLRNCARELVLKKFNTASIGRETVLFVQKLVDQVSLKQS